MVFLTVAVAIVGYMIAVAARQFIKNQREAMLEPPVNLFQEVPKKNDRVERDKEIRTRYTKVQVRQRFKKGRS